MPTEMEMPKYRCHKEVWALKIKAIEEVYDYTNCTRLIPEDETYGPILVDRRFVKNHQPEAGGYYVVYEDGYKSYSPSDPFEKGYTRI